MEPVFALQVTENARGPVVRMAGELDIAAAGTFRECLHRLAGETITLDFTDVTFMDSTAIGILVAAQRRSREAGGTIMLHGVQHAQMRVLEIAGLVNTLNFDEDGGVPKELVDAARQELEYPADETNEG